jgi:flavin-dependent dehydrogenase
MNKKYDIIIVGAGPAGLSAAISIKQNSDLNVLVIEKQSKIGERKRGETLKYDKFLEEKLFYSGFFNDIAVNKTNKYRFYSPSTKKFADIESTEERYMINWDGLINELIKKGEQCGIKIKTGNEVTDLLFKNDVYSGVKVSEGSEISTLDSDLILLADGCENPLLNKYGIQTPEENCPILTINADNVKFPRGKNSASSDYVQFVGNFKEIHKNQNIKYWWEKFLDGMPIFSDRFKNSTINHFDISFLPYGGPKIETIIPKERIFLVGDNAGHNESTGGSGLVSSMRMGYEIGQIATEIYSSGRLNDFTSVDYKKELLKRIQKTKIYRHLKKLAKVSINLRRTFFQELNTPEKVDAKWDSFLAPTMKNAAEFF